MPDQQQNNLEPIILSQARGIIDPLAGAETVFSDESRIKALAKMYLEKRAPQPISETAIQSIL